MVDNIGNERRGVASCCEVVKIHARPIVERVALACHIDVHGHAEIQICEFRKPLTHVVVDQVHAPVRARFLRVSRRRQAVVAAHGQIKSQGRSVAIGEHRGISPSQFHGLANHIPRDVEGERSSLIGVAHGPIDIEFKVGHAQRTFWLVRVRLMGQRFDRPTCSRWHDPAHRAHRGRFVHHLVRSHHNCSCDHVHPSQVSDWQHPTPACDLHLPRQVGFPNHLSLHFSLYRQPRHAQIFRTKIRQVRGALVATGFSNCHVCFQEGLHFSSGVVGIHGHQIRPPIA